MNDERFSTAVNVMRNICNQINNENEYVEYVVLQGLNLDDVYASDTLIIQKITEFYNVNWQGNVDFMHIPNFEQTLYNCYNYPIIIARNRITKEMIGISTIKYDENINHLDPYYPFIRENYFSITGILTKRDNSFSGGGKKIYEIVIRSINDYNRLYPNTSLMCVIDCRNRNSINAVYEASKVISEDGIAATPKIVGFYTVTENNKMLEALTIVIKINNGLINTKRETINYSNKGDLFLSLSSELINYIGEDNIMNPIVNDDEAGLVSYYGISSDVYFPNIITNGTELGNDRVINKECNVQGPYVLKLVRRSNG